MCQPVTNDKCPYCEWPPAQLACWLWHGYQLPDALKEQMCDFCSNERGTGKREGNKSSQSAAGKKRAAEVNKEYETVIKRNVAKAKARKAA